MTHPVLTPTSPTKAAHRSPWHRMPYRLSSTSSRGMRLRSSSFSIVNRGQSLEYEQQAPQELQASIGRRAWELCGAILSTESPSLAERSCWTKSPQLSLSNVDARLALRDREAPSSASRMPSAIVRSSSARSRHARDCRADRTFPTLGLSFRFLQEGRSQRRSDVISNTIEQLAELTKASTNSGSAL